MLFKNRKIEQLVERIDKGDKNANYELSVLFDKGLTDEEYNRIRKNVYSRHIQQNPNDAYAYYMLAILEDNKKVAEQLYIHSAQLGYLGAMSALGLYYSEYSNGEYSNSGFGYDEQKSQFWYRKAAETGDPAAMVDYATFCLSNQEEKMFYYQKAANLGYWKGMYELGKCYHSPATRMPTPEEEEKAKYWLLRAADLCNDPRDTSTFASLAFELGNIYGKKYLMRTVLPSYQRQDAIEALRWFTYALVFDFPCKESIHKISEYCNIEYTDRDYQFLRQQAVDRFDWNK